MFFVPPLIITKTLACRAEKGVVPYLSGHQEMGEEIRITAHVTGTQTASTPSLWEAPPGVGTSLGIWRSVPPLWPPPTAAAKALGL